MIKTAFLSPNQKIFMDIIRKILRKKNRWQEERFMNVDKSLKVEEEFDD